MIVPIYAKVSNIMNAVYILIMNIKIFCQHALNIFKSDSATIFIRTCLGPSRNRFTFGLYELKLKIFTSFWVIRFIQYSCLFSVKIRQVSLYMHEIILTFTWIYICKEIFNVFVICLTIPRHKSRLSIPCFVSFFQYHMSSIDATSIYDLLRICEDCDITGNEREIIFRFFPLYPYFPRFFRNSSRFQVRTKEF